MRCEPCTNAPLFLENVEIWVYQHPTTIKVLKIAGFILGIGCIACGPHFSISVAITLYLSGSLLILASTVAFFVLDLFVPPHHQMCNHAYKAAQCEGGRLYYEGDVPILSLNADNPYQAGKAHGYLCGEAIHHLFRRLDLMYLLIREHNVTVLPETLAEIRQIIPREYLVEMEGIIEGYTQWSKEQTWWTFPRALTLDDLILLHLLPDHSFSPQLPQHKSQALPAVACSSLVSQDVEKGFVLARNMDWPSLGIAGRYSLIVNRRHQNGLYSTIEVGFPGMIGTLTGMNNQGLCLAMNVSDGPSTDQINGLPACLYNRDCLERFRVPFDVLNFVDSAAPLSAYHLTVVSPVDAVSIHFYQAPDWTTTARSLSRDSPLITLNCLYNPEPVLKLNPDIKRQNALQTFFQNGNDRPLEEALALPYVNNWDTTHRIVIEPQTSTFKVAFDNAFAGSALLHSLPVKNLFEM